MDYAMTIGECKAQAYQEECDELIRQSAQAEFWQEHVQRSRQNAAIRRMSKAWKGLVSTYSKDDL